MKKIMIAGVAVFLLLSGVTLAQQSGGEKAGSPVGEMMQGMMKGEHGGEGGVGGIGGMERMMRMMKMMDQCGAMMESTHDQGEKAKESQNK